MVEMTFWREILKFDLPKYISLLRLPEYNTVFGLNHRYLFSHGSRGQKSKIKVLADLVSFSASPLCFIDSCLLAVSSFGHLSVWTVYVLISSYKENLHIELGSILMSLLTSVTFLKMLFPNTISFWGTRGLGLQHMN